MLLSDVASIQMGYTLRGRPDEPGSRGMPVIQLRDIAPDGVTDPHNLAHHQPDAFSPRWFVSTGDVLFRSRGDRTTAVALDDRFASPVVAVSPLIILRPDRDIVLPAYLAWAINQRPAQRQLDNEARGTSMRMIPRSALDSLELDIPDLETQRRIVELDELAEQERDLSLRLAEARRQMIGLQLVDRAAAPRPGIDQHRKAS